MKCRYTYDNNIASWLQLRRSLPHQPRVDFINPFTLYAKLLCSTPSSYALRQTFTPKKASQKFGAGALELGVEHKWVYEIHP